MHLVLAWELTLEAGKLELEYPCPHAVVVVVVVAVVVVVVVVGVVVVVVVVVVVAAAVVVVVIVVVVAVKAVVPVNSDVKTCRAAFTNRIPHGPIFETILTNYFQFSQWRRLVFLPSAIAPSMEIPAVESK